MQMQFEAPLSLDSYEKKIFEQKRQIQKLNHKNNQLLQQLNQALKQKNKYQFILNNDPLNHIFEGMKNAPMINTFQFQDYKHLQNRLRIYEQKLQECKRNIIVMENRLNEKDFSLLNGTRQKINLQNQLLSMERNNNFLRSELQIKKEKEIFLLEQIANYQAMKQETSQHLLDLQRKSFELQDKYTRQLPLLSEKLVRSSSVWTNIYETTQKFCSQRKTESMNMNQNSSQYVRELVQKIRKQQQIMQQMGRQLDSRNQQLSKLASNTMHLKRNKKGFSSEDKSSQQFTIKSFLFNNKKKQQSLNDLYKKYKQILQILEKNKRQKELLEKEYEKLKSDYEKSKNIKDNNEALLKQYQIYKKKCQSLTSINGQLQRNLDCLGTQNTALHKMMFDRYGEKQYLSKINDEVIKYEERSRERETQEKWANFKQLINMNRKLKEKLERK